MKKVLVSIIVAGGMVLGGTAVANAATQAPSIKKPVASAAEGTATHEKSETSTTQKAESKVKTIHKKSSKKVSKKKSALVAKKK